MIETLTNAHKWDKEALTLMELAMIRCSSPAAMQEYVTAEGRESYAHKSDAELVEDVREELADAASYLAVLITKFGPEYRAALDIIAIGHAALLDAAARSSKE
jgi:hypothetical protein